MPSSNKNLYEFGGFHLDPQERLLLSDGKSVRISPKAFQLLVVLLEHSGKLVNKSELLEIIWPDVSVEEGNLAVLISQLRKILGDDRGKPEFIETVSKFGYRFVAPAAQRVRADQEPRSESSLAAIDLPVPETLLLSPSPISIALSRNSFASHFAAVLVLTALSLGSLFLFGRSILHPMVDKRDLPRAVSIHSWAILPFRVLGAGSDDEDLGKRTADALVVKLKSSDGYADHPVTVINGNDHSLTPEEIGKQQRVDAVLNGKIQCLADRIHLSVQLIRVQDGAELWADAFDEKLTSPFELENEISEHVFQSLALKLVGGGPRQPGQKSSQNAEAYDAYVRGRYFWNKRTREGVQTGLKYFRQAIRLDPGFAAAYEGVADSYATLGVYAVLPPDDAFPVARDAAQKALKMDDELSDAHATMGIIHFYYDWDGLAAENEFQRALQIDPNNAMAHVWYAEALAAMGRFPEALEEARRAETRDPLSQAVNSIAGWTFCMAGQTDRSIQILQKAIELDPNFPGSHFRLGIAYENKGLYVPAINEFQKAVQLSGGNTYYLASLAHAFGISGRSAKAHQVLRELKTRAVHEPVPSFAFAIAYLGLNDKDAALQWLGKTSADHSTSMAFAKVDPTLAALRPDPRFITAAKHLNF